MESIYIGADIGGSHITCRAVDPGGNMIEAIDVVRQEVDCHARAEDILSGWTNALSRLMNAAGRDNVSGIGFAMPGPFDYPGGIAWFRGVQKFDSLHGVDVRSELKSRLGLAPAFPVRFLNDATAFAIGEAWMGEAVHYGRNMAITLGTGFGSAFISEGIPVESGPDVPESGCVYHLPYGGSIADDHFSTRWFIRRYAELSGKNIDGVKELAVMASMVGPGQEEALAIFDEFGEALGRFLAPWLTKFSAGCLTVGGNISQAWPLFSDTFLGALASGGWSGPAFLSGLGEQAGIAGAARLCDDSFYSKLPYISAK